MSEKSRPMIMVPAEDWEALKAERDNLVELLRESDSELLITISKATELLASITTLKLWGWLPIMLLDAESNHDEMNSAIREAIRMMDGLLGAVQKSEARNELSRH